MYFKAELFYRVVISGKRRGLMFIGANTKSLCVLAVANAPYPCIQKAFVYKKGINN